MRRGEVWLINLDPTLGSEIKKTRPAVIVNGLSKTSAADTFQVRSVAQERFVRQVGKLSDIAMLEISEALAIVLNIEL